MTSWTYSVWSKLGFILLTVVATGCGRERTLDVGAFGSYVELFEAEAAARGQRIVVKDLIIKFGAVAKASESGVCELKGSETPKIIVNEKIWNQSTLEEREQFMFHELGHCVLHRVHNAEIQLNGDPISIMHPYRMYKGTYEKKRAEYVDELFANAFDF